MTAVKAPTHASVQGVNFIAQWEGFVGYAYDDAAGNATVGFGHLLHQGPVTRADELEYGTKARPQCSRKRALALLRLDLAVAEAAVASAVHVPLKVTERDALISLAFNIGAAAFAGSTLVRLLNGGHRWLAGLQFLRWDRAGNRVLLGLSRRRRAERWLFRKGKYR